MATPSAGPAGSPPLAGPEMGGPYAGGGPAPSPSTSAPPPRGHTGLLVGGITVAVVVVVVLGLALAGILPFFQSPRSGGPTTFSQAGTDATAAASGFAQGPWNILGAVGIDSASALTLPSLSGTSYSGCTVTAESTAARGNLTLPSGPAPRDQGSAPVWLFLLASGSSALLVLVLNGTGTVYGSIVGTCTSLLSLVTPLGSGTVDSPAAVSTANGAGGSTFVNSHADSSVAMVVTGGVSYLGIGRAAQWSVLYSSCPPPSSTGVPLSSSSEFNATVDASTGTLLGSNTTAAVCGGTLPFPVPLPISTPPVPGSSGGGATKSLALASPIERSAGGTNWYNFSVISTSGGLTFGGMYIGVATSSGVPVLPGYSSLTALGLSGCTIATGSLSTATFGTPSGVPSSSLCASGNVGPTAVVTNQDTISLATMTSLSGDTLAVGFSGGTTSVMIP